MRSLSRAFGVLFRAAPVAFCGTFLIAVLQGAGPNVVTLIGARLVGLVPSLSTSSSARNDAMAALGLLAVALIMERVAAALAPITFSYLGYRFTSALDRERMKGISALPGLQHLESSELADSLEEAERTKTAAPELLNRVITVVRRAAMLGGSLIIVTRLAWWVPAVVALSAVLIAINDWRHAGRESAILRDETPGIRYANYHRDLALRPEYAREVRVLGMGDWLARRQDRLWNDASRSLFTQLRRRLAGNALANLFRVVLLTVPIVVAVINLRGGRLSAEDFTAVVLALRTASNGMFVLEGIPGKLRLASSFVPSVFKIADLAKTDPRLNVSGRMTPPAEVLGEIRFENVSFGYPGTDRLVLDGVNLSIGAGESLALVGENGAGKSTIVKLLCRFYDPTAGRITVDGVDIRDFDLGEWRERLAVVFQDFIRLPVSVTENLSFGDYQDDPDVGDKARTAAGRAGVLGFVDTLPEGWETNLSREFGGVDLSGGEWQRLALARLLYRQRRHKSSVLVLDEPTAALDAEVEADLYSRFEGLTSGATTLIISHRFSTVRMASRIAVLEDGQIVEEGGHDALLAEGGRYAELFTLQAARFQTKDRPA